MDSSPKKMPREDLIDANGNSELHLALQSNTTTDTEVARCAVALTAPDNVSQPWMHPGALFVHRFLPLSSHVIPARLAPFVSSDIMLVPQKLEDDGT